MANPIVREKPLQVEKTIISPKRVWKLTTGCCISLSMRQTKPNLRGSSIYAIRVCEARGDVVE